MKARSRSVPGSVPASAQKSASASASARAPAASSAGDLPIPREVELKLFVPPSSVGRLWDAAAVTECATGPLQVARLENRYFDTPERDLARHGMALRLRRIGRRWVQTLKTASSHEGALSARGEWEMAVAGPALDLALLVATPLAALDTDPKHPLAGRLRHVHTTRFRRQTRLLRLPGGSTAELAFDLGSIVSGRGRGRRTLGICEVEIERKGPAGGPADDGAIDADADADANADANENGSDLLRFAARLARELPLIPLAESKAARGHRLAEGRRLEAARVRLPAPDFADASALHLGRVLAAGEKVLLANVHALFEIAGTVLPVVGAANGVDDTVGDAAADVVTGAVPLAARVPAEPAEMTAGVEFVHQARVAIRRMRSALRLFRPAVSGRRLIALDADLRETGRAFGGARDWDVLLEVTMPRLVDAAGADRERRAALAALATEVDARRVEGRRALMDHLDAGSFGRTALALARAIERLSRETARPSRRPHDAIGLYAPAWLTEQRRRVVRSARRIAVLDDEARHALRIEVKRLRYALDLFEPLYDRAVVDAFGDTLAVLQDRLGRINDAIVADQLLASIADLPAIDSVRAPYGTWLLRHVLKQLPKVAAQSVEFELTPVPWRRASIVAGRTGD